MRLMVHAKKKGPKITESLHDAHFQNMVEFRPGQTKVVRTWAKRMIKSWGFCGLYIVGYLCSDGGGERACCHGMGWLQINWMYGCLADGFVYCVIRLKTEYELTVFRDALRSTISLCLTPAMRSQCWRNFMSLIVYGTPETMNTQQGVRLGSGSRGRERCPFVSTTVPLVAGSIPACVATIFFRSRHFSLPGVIRLSLSRRRSKDDD